MARTETKPLAYYGIRNAKYCIRTADGEIGTEAKELPKAKSIVLNPALNIQPGYANDEKIYAIPSDQGYTGTYGCTGQDEEFEIALGQLIELANGTLAAVKVTDMTRFDLYFEYTMKPVGKKAFVIKEWVYGIELGKPTISHNTNTENITVGEYQYPLTVYGEKIMTSDGKKAYRDSQGFERYALIVKSVPGDDDYKTFGDAPIKPAKESDGSEDEG